MMQDNNSDTDAASLHTAEQISLSASFHSAEVISDSESFATADETTFAAESLHTVRSLPSSSASFASAISGNDAESLANTDRVAVAISDSISFHSAELSLSEQILATPGIANLVHIERAQLIITQYLEKLQQDYSWHAARANAKKNFFEQLKRNIAEEGLSSAVLLSTLATADRSQLFAKWNGIQNSRAAECFCALYYLATGVQLHYAQLNTLAEENAPAPRINHEQYITHLLAYSINYRDTAFKHQVLTHLRALTTQQRPPATTTPPVHTDVASLITPPKEVRSGWSLINLAQQVIQYFFPNSTSTPAIEHARTQLTTRLTSLQQTNQSVIYHVHVTKPVLILGTHAYNRDTLLQAPHGKNFCYLQHFPTDQNNQIFSYQNQETHIQDATIMSEISLLSCFAHHLPCFAPMTLLQDRLFAEYYQIHQAYMTFLKYPNDMPKYFCQSILGQKAIERLIHLKKGIRLKANYWVADETDNHLTLVLKVLMKLFVHNCHRQKKCSSLLHSLSLLLHHQSLTDSMPSVELTLASINSQALKRFIADSTPPSFASVAQLEATLHTPVAATRSETIAETAPLARRTAASPNENLRNEQHALFLLLTASNINYAQIKQCMRTTPTLCNAIWSNGENALHLLIRLHRHSADHVNIIKTILLFVSHDVDLQQKNAAQQTPLQLLPKNLADVLYKMVLDSADHSCTAAQPIPNLLDAIRLTNPQQWQQLKTILQQRTVATPAAATNSSASFWTSAGIANALSTIVPTAVQGFIAGAPDAVNRFINSYIP